MYHAVAWLVGNRLVWTCAVTHKPYHLYVYYNHMNWLSLLKVGVNFVVGFVRLLSMKVTAFCCIETPVCATEVSNEETSGIDFVDIVVGDLF